MKKSTIILAFITIFSIVAVVATSCKKDDTVNFETYVIKVDSIIYPDTITFGDTLKIKFYGLVGENSCYQFNQWKTSVDQTSNVVQITTMGVHYLDQNCFDGITYLNGAQYNISGFPVGSFTIKILQPDNTTMDSPLIVKQ